MPGRLILKADIVKGVPGKWAKQYKSHAYREQHKITHSLLALPEGFTASQVNSIIGNDSWTENVCDECGLDKEVLVRLGAEPGSGDGWLDLCADCLHAAAALAKQGE